MFSFICFRAVSWRVSGKQSLVFSVIYFFCFYYLCSIIFTVCIFIHLYFSLDLSFSPLIYLDRGQIYRPLNQLETVGNLMNHHYFGPCLKPFGYLCSSVASWSSSTMLWSSSLRSSYSKQLLFVSSLFGDVIEGDSAGWWLPLWLIREWKNGRDTFMPFFYSLPPLRRPLFWHSISIILCGWECMFG